ncbi:hypothetical protein SANTM175S_02726 [Streptomyces antimycoticus]
MSTEDKPFFDDPNAALREVAQNPAAYAHYLADFHRVVLRTYRPSWRSSSARPACTAAGPAWRATRWARLSCAVSRWKSP